MTVSGIRSPVTQWRFRAGSFISVSRINLMTVIPHLKIQLTFVDGTEYPEYETNSH